MRAKTFFGLLLLSGCVKHVQTRVETSKPACDFSYAADRSYAYCQVGPSDWLVVSKVGSEKAAKFICPKDFICTTDTVGTMFRIQRKGTK